ncbi:MAG TPA: hypothetical protein VFB14_24540 [Bryobacteraceae bacterium]|nr:hypothetical protein [Bryobacteraceae bacterium]
MVQEALTLAELRERGPLPLLETRTAQVDAIVAEAAALHLAPNIGSAFSVTAVGGYGRRELFPHSDVDLLLLFAVESDLEGIRDPIAAFLHALWDAGLHASHSVRTIEECLRLHEQNTELNISLLDLRLVTGDARLFHALHDKLPEFYRKSAPALTRRLAELVRNRHAKFNGTVYHLEPNIKEAPGGIRDIHFLRWFSQLESNPDAVSESPEAVEAARSCLFAIRCFLHLRTGRDNNLLNFELQDEAAQSLPPRAMPPEDWMREYYRHARRLFQTTVRALEFIDAHDQSLLRQFRDWRGRLSTSEFTVSRERIFLRNPAQTFSSAESVLRLFTFAARHGVPLSWDAKRRLRTALMQIEAQFRESSGDWTIWRELLAQPKAGLALRAMQETGVLAAAIPEWHSIDGLVVRDFYHRYTVDEHTLVAIESIDGLASGAGAPARFRELFLEEDEPAILRMALFLHDIGKGTAPGDHVRGSLETGAQILNRLKVPAGAQQAIDFLIEQHLVLSQLMNGRDLDDPATARLLTSQVGIQEDLRRLTLLTYADISAVNPTAMTPWRLEQLWRTYTLGTEQLTRELSTSRIQPSGIAGRPELARFLEGLPMRYLRTHTEAERERHFQLEQRRKSEGVAVEIQPAAGAYLMTVVAGDRPGLFASLCGALASFGMNILKAEAFSNASHTVLDLFRFNDPMRTLELNSGEVNRLQWTVECVVRGSLQVSDLLKRRRAAPRPSSHAARIAPNVRFNHEASDHSTLIEFIGEDRPGLLYELASTLSCNGCDIEVVLIDTEGHKAIDVFYVTREGGKLDEATQRVLQRALVEGG